MVVYAESPLHSVGGTSEEPAGLSEVRKFLAGSDG